MRFRQSLTRFAAYLALSAALLWAVVFIVAIVKTTLIKSIPYDFWDYVVNIQVRGYWPGEEPHGRVSYIIKFITLTVALETAGVLSFFYLRRRDAKPN